MNKWRIPWLTAVAALVVLGSAVSRAGQAESILERTGVTKGICVVLGDTSGEAALDLARRSELQIYVQLPQAQEVETARRLVDKAGFYGTRIAIERGGATGLHLADNVADALIVLGGAMDIPEGEVLRVLRPEGKALLGDRVLTKPFPEGVDDWSHPYHGPDNNPQSRDRVIQGPYLTQFLADPRYAPVPQVAVASAGRVFKAFGHVAFKKREEPYLNKLVAFNGYNGTMLWQRDLTAGIMVHRNTFVATPTILYVADDRSCKLIDALSGQLKDEVVPPLEIAGGTFWKWMALEKGVLYALIGEQEPKDPTMRWGLEKHGWPWNPISQGFNQPDRVKDSGQAYLAHPWGFGQNVLAIDPQTKKVLWHYHEAEPMDSRAMCLKNGRIYAFRFGAYLTCLDTKTGAVFWRKTPDNAPELFEALGPYSNRQGASWNWRTTAYLKCSDKALYFAGPQVGKLVAASTQDGRVLWQHPYNNFQLIIRDEAVYGISGQNDEGNLSKEFEPLTGRVLAEFRTGRRACTRPTGALDAIFYRARGGSTRFDLGRGSPQLLSPMRPPCHDGVTIANGLLYWWPSVCDCQLTLYGITCLAPARGFDFKSQATDAERLETSGVGLKEAENPSESPSDWPTFRANNTCSATSKATIPANADLLWQTAPERIAPSSGPVLTPPVVVGDTVCTGGSDGIVRALSVSTGKPLWRAYTGGAIRLPPAIWQGRAFVGSGDGWVYAFASRTGQLLWRFRAAPAERKIPVYGSLLSTWPVASGVLVEDGVAYVAAGIVNYDGTHVYALDAATGRIRWQNSTSGHLDPQARSGVSVQGHLLLHDRKLYLAGGNAVSPAVYDTQDGRCLNDPNSVQRITQNNVLLSQSPRGWELSLLADQVVAFGRPSYAHPQYEVYDPSVFSRVFLTSTSGRDVAWVSTQNKKQVLCFDGLDKGALRQRVLNPRDPLVVDWAGLGIKKKPVWSYDCAESVAIATCRNAVVVAERSKVVALNMEDGHLLWSHRIPSSPVEWGLAVDRDGRVIVVLEDGRVLCFGHRRSEVADEKGAI
jgi:outer membrane protein assembly factor BamB